jgi:hypothetical protein
LPVRRADTTEENKFELVSQSQSPEYYLFVPLCHIDSAPRRRDAETAKKHTVRRVPTYRRSGRWLRHHANSEVIPEWSEGEGRRVRVKEKSSNQLLGTLHFALGTWQHASMPAMASHGNSWYSNDVYVVDLFPPVHFSALKFRIFQGEDPDGP